ncbi:MAG: hypothetical protein ABIB12_02390 [Patescibacteria group bacterium]
MNQMGDALEAAGYTPEDVTKLRSDISRLREFKSVLVGFAQIVVVKHVIDCDADPFCPDGWTVGEHRKGGQLEWDPAKVALYLSENQQDGKVIEGNQLREELKGKPVYNANLLDYLLAHSELIPESWKGKFVFFWGTIYRYPGGILLVRSLIWSGDRWSWNLSWLDYGFHGNFPAAVPASI